MSESVEQKAARLLVGGALKVTHVLGQEVEARVEGDHGTYRVGYSPRRGWHCSCPARERRPGYACAHLKALMLIAARTSRQQRPTG